MRGPSTTVIVVAAGSGTRFGTALPKQFCLLDGLPVVMHCINRFRKFLAGAHIILVLSADRIDYWRQICEEFSFESPVIATGGATRWESVKNALPLIVDDSQVVMVHDAARPLVSRDVIDRLQKSLNDGAEGALPVLPMTDSLRQLNPDGTSKAVDRSRYMAVQTPQAFPTKLLVNAYNQPYCGTMTDDASVMEAAGYFDIRLVPGDEATLKITRPIDLSLTEIYLHGSAEGN